MFMSAPHQCYTITDTGAVCDMLDLAQRHWPDVQDRRQLLLRLADAGAAEFAESSAARPFERRFERQQAALRGERDFIDAELD